MPSPRIAALALVPTLALHWTGGAATQPAGPPPPEKYKVVLRYHIPSPRDQHVVEYTEMIKDLGRVGFDFQPKLKPFPNSDYENRNKTILTGVVAADKALRCLSAPH